MNKMFSFFFCKEAGSRREALDGSEEIRQHVE